MVEEGQNQPPKRIRFEEIRTEEDEDRISRLPDCLLVEILSRLPATKCAVKTGALCRRWKHVWTAVPKLKFIHRGNPSADFVSFVDKTLGQRGKLKLKNLTLYCSYNDQFESQVHNWIRYAINCNVEEVNMMLWDPERLIRFQLDQCFLINSRFTDLTLRGCQFNPIEAISWENLRRLCITNAALDEDLIEIILSGCPVLESLMLKECAGYRRLNITSKSVKKLVFDRYTANGAIHCDYLEDVIEINAPSILSQVIQNDLLLWKILLINVSSLIEADLDYFYHGHYETTFKEAEEEFLNRLISNLQHVKELKIGLCCFKVLSRLEAKGFIFPSNLKICDDVCSYPLDSDDDSLELSDHSSSDSDNGPIGNETDSEDDDDAVASSNEEDGA